MAYEFDGVVYERASSHQREWGMSLVEDLHLRGSEHVLDLGCGDGTITVEIATHLPGGKAVGIDASRGMIQAARLKAVSNVSFIHMDINDLAFEERFDIVFSNASLHWIRDHDTLLRNTHKVLRPGGRIRFNFAGDGNCSHFIDVVRDAMTMDEYADSFSDFVWPWYMPSVADYRAVVESSEFVDSHVWEENADRYFPDEESMTLWIDQPSLVPFIDHLAGKRRSSFRNYVLGRMLDETRQSDGRCVETFRRINVRARKISMPD